MPPRSAYRARSPLASAHDNGRTTNCSACTYPGAGDRVRNDNGIVVAVIVTNLCGNGAVDEGEACNLGSLNGERNTCCGDDCRFVPEGNLSRPAVDDCDKAEICDGASASCSEDQKKLFGSFCTDDQTASANLARSSPISRPRPMKRPAHSGSGRVSP